MRINIGCGQTPTVGWRNFDNSLSLWLAKIPLLPELLKRINFLGPQQYENILFARSSNIERLDATRGFPFPDETVDVVYSSHMLEHLDQSEARIFLSEAKRILISGGILRLAVPDLRKQVDRYVTSGNADEFIAGTRMCVPRPRTIQEKIKYLLIGGRHHQWMYDGQSLCRLLQSSGFVNVQEVPPGETRIPDPGVLNLRERISESVYVEAEKA